MSHPFKTIYVLLLAVTLSGATAENPAAWTEKDTRLANHYIGLLQQNPEYGTALDLLWETYEEKGSTALLLEYFSERQTTLPVAELVHAHLLRKTGDLEAATAAYQSVLDRDPKNVFALGALTDLAIERSDPETAITSARLLSAQLPATGEETAEHYLRLGQLEAQEGETVAAAASFTAAVAAAPNNPIIRRRSAEGFLQTGRLDAAIAQFRSLAESPGTSPDPGALQELARLYEIDGQFDAAAKTLREGLAISHFKHHIHSDFFRRLVRLYEREDRLPELGNTITGNASGESGLLAAVRFYRLTAAPEKVLAWLRKLAAAAPRDMAYRRELAEALVDNDAYAEAAGVLDELLRETSHPPLPLVFKRCEIDTRLGDKEAAAERLAQALEKTGNNRAARGAILAFAQKNYIDSVAELLLTESATGSPADEEPIFALAKFYFARGRHSEAAGVLERFINSGGGADTGRITAAGGLLINLEEYATASTLLKSVLDPASPDPEPYTQLAEALFARGQTKEAIENLEMAWQLTTDHAARVKLDELAFSYLQHQSYQEKRDAQEKEQRFRMFFQPGQIFTDTSQELRPDKVPPESHRFASAVAQQAAESDDIPYTWRAAWWAFRTRDIREAYRWLRVLYRLQPEPDTASSQLTLAVARASGNTSLARRQLEALLRLDTENATAYSHMLADLHMAGDDPDTESAIKILTAAREADSEDTGLIESLANAYTTAGLEDEKLDLWRSTFREAGDNVRRRRLLSPLAAALENAGLVDDALGTYTRVILEEQDDEKRRDLFERQLDLARRHSDPDDTTGEGFLADLLEHYTRLQARNPLSPFFPRALAHIHSSMGNRAGAFGAMKRAYYSTQNPPVALVEELRDLALENGDGRSAVYFQRQLVFADGGTSDPSGWDALVGLLENQLDLGGADAVRERFEHRFSHDPDVLGRLLDRYEKTGQHSAALRLAERLSKLRPWDADSAFQLGLLYLHQARPDEAATAFQTIIDNTGDGQAPGTPPPGILSGIPLPFEAVLQNYFLRQQERRRVEVYLERTAASSKTPVRTRAIHQAAEIAVEAGGTALEHWINSWRALSEERPDEALVALLHTGDSVTLAPLLTRLLAGGESEGAYIEFATLALSAGLTETIGQWLATPADKPAQREKKHRFLAGATELLLRNESPGVSRDTLAALYDAGHFSTSEILAFAQIADGANHAQEALSIGTLALAPGRQKPTPQQLITLAHWAKLGRDTGNYQVLLQEFFQSASENSATGQSISNFLLPAFSELHQLVADPGDRSRLLETAERTASNLYNPYLTTKPELFLDKIARFGGAHGDPAADTYPVPTPPGRHNYSRDDLYWIDLTSAVTRYRHYGMAPVARAYTDLVEDSIAAPPAPEDISGERYTRFSTESLITRLRAATYPERRHAVASFLTRPMDDDEIYTTASRLKEHCFYREAIPFFKKLIGKDPLSADYVREFLQTCGMAKEPAPALSYFREILVDKTLPPPKGNSLYGLTERFALLLHETGDHETLRLFGTTAPKPDRNTETEPLSRAELPYLIQLAALYRSREQYGDAAEVLKTVVRLEPSSGHARLDLAKALHKDGQREEAIGLLTDLNADARVSKGLVAESLKELAEIHAKNGDTAAILPLMARARAYEMPFRIAEIAAGAGLAEEAISMLKLRIRDTPIPHEQRKLGVTLMGFATLPDTSSTARARALAGTFIDIPYTPSQIKPIADLMSRHREILHPTWQSYTETDISRAHQGKALYDLADLFLNTDGDRDKQVAALLSTEGADAQTHDLALAHLLDRGETDTAADYWRQTLLLPAQQRPGQPHHVAIATARGDDAALREIFARGMHEPRGIYRFGTALAPALARAGHPAWAGELFKKYWREHLAGHRGQLHGSEKFAEFLRSYTGFLSGQKRTREAESLITKVHDLLPGAAPQLIADLYRNAGVKTAQADWLRRFHLTSGLRQETEALLSTPPEPSP